MTEINYSWDLNSEAELDEALAAAAAITVDDVAVSEAPVTEAAAENFSLELDHYDQKEQEDKLWQARTGLNFDTLCGSVETLIFMSDRPITLQKIKAQIDEELPLRVLHEAITKLQAGYEEKHHGIRLVEIAEGYQFRTKATYAKFVQNLFKVQSLVLTPTALEVLAIIAYKQPVSKTEIEKIRGVDSSHIVRALMDKRLVKITGRSEELGRPSVFGTTEEFLEVFNLASIDQLPPENELAELATRPEVAAIADIKSVVFGGDKKKFDFDELEELDKLSESIKDIAAETDFTMLLKQEEKRRIDGAEGVKKSAFDILEEFVLREATVKQNREAVVSEPPMSALDPKLADLEFDGILNAPEIDEEWEREHRESLLAADAENADLEDAAAVVESEAMAEEFENLEDEARELEMALDQAFANLTGENLSIREELEVDIDEQLKSLDFTLDSAIKQGMEMDMDLSFLTEALPEDDISNQVE
ncbi:MAG: SMC-Scp complex subunit ScpB [Bacteriovoracia bacterium]